MASTSAYPRRSSPSFRRAPTITTNCWDCAWRSTRAKPVGVVAQVLETGAGAPVLMVRGERGEILIPMARDFVMRVDLGQGRMLVRVPELV